MASVVTIDAMGTQANIAQAIRDRGADYLLAVKDNQPTLADSMRDFVAQFNAAHERTPARRGTNHGERSWANRNPTRFRV